MAFVEQQQGWLDKHCFSCGKKGHQVSDCKSLTKKEKDAVFARKKKEWVEKDVASYASTAEAEKIGQNHLATDQKVAVEAVNIPVVDTE